MHVKSCFVAFPVSITLGIDGLKIKKVDSTSDLLI